MLVRLPVGGSVEFVKEEMSVFKRLLTLFSSVDNWKVENSVFANVITQFHYSNRGPCFLAFCITQSKFQIIDLLVVFNCK